MRTNYFQRRSRKFSPIAGDMFGFWVSILPLVQGECAVLGRKVIPNSFCPVNEFGIE